VPARWVALAVAAVVVAGAAIAWGVVSAQRSAPAAIPLVTPTPTIPPPAPSPSPSPTTLGPAADESQYDLAGLTPVDVYAVVPELPVDDDPFGALTGELVRAVPDSIPVFAEPGGAPVASLPREHGFDGTTLPVIERLDHWVRVLLTGRQAMPSAGSPAQLTGWLRVADLEFSEAAATVEVDIAARTIDLVHADGTRERVADDLGWGTEATPTPVGRSFVMMVRTEPGFAYTRGHPLTYLSVQSPVLDGFGGAPVAVTAFHYHDARSGAISNACLRVSAEAAERLGQLPPGTPVYIR
jgi:hypothetical protein